MAVVAAMHIEWKEPIATHLKYMMMFHFDVKVLRIGCVHVFSALAQYIGTLVATLVLFMVGCLIHVAVRLVWDHGQFWVTWPR